MGVWEIFVGVWEIFENCGKKWENCVWGGKHHAGKWLFYRLERTRETLDEIVSDTLQTYKDGPNCLYGTSVESITLPEAMAKGKESLIENFLDFSIYTTKAEQNLFFFNLANTLKIHTAKFPERKGMPKSKWECPCFLFHCSTVRK